ncbi:MAG: NAD-glutamate dehydrogenase [bacterium]
MKNAVTEKLISAVKSRSASAPGEDEIAFLRDFYHRLSGQDFAADKALALRRAALRHRRLGRVRKAGETLIEIYNLDAARDESIGEQDATVINLITDDKPFIIDSLTIKLNALRKTPQRIAHPTFTVRRDARHRVVAMHRYTGKKSKATPTDQGGAIASDGDGAIASDGDGAIESYIQFAIDFTPPSEHQRMARELRGIVADLEIVIDDWAKMRARTRELAAMLDQRKHGPAFAEHGELLRWMESHNFAFIGYAEMSAPAHADGESGVESNARGRGARIAANSTLGILRADQGAAGDLLPSAVCSKTSALVFTKSLQRSTIHRNNYLDCLMIEHTPKPGAARRKVSCILGFFAGAAARQPTANIPHLRNKTAYILKESTLIPGGHGYKALQMILETLPREKLLQMDTRSLYALCMTLMNHLERRKTRVHLHRNICGHFYSCLAYIPRDLFNSDLRRRIQDFLGERLDASEVSFNVYFSDSILTRIHYIIHCRDRSARAVDAGELERAIQAMARDWNDNLHEAIRQQRGFEDADRALALYRDAFPRGYQDEFSIEQAIRDIDCLARIEHDEHDDRAADARRNIHAVLTYRARDDNDDAPADDIASFKLYSDDHSIALSDVLPILGHMGVRVLRERPYEFNRCDGRALWLYDFEIARQDRRAFDIAAYAHDFQATFVQAWHGGIEDDGYNQLTLLAGLDWKQIGLLRACYRYLKQIRLRYSEHYIIDALAGNPQLAAAAVALFNARFDPAVNGAGARKWKSAIKRELDCVASLDEDRIIRALLDVIDATVRTNYYQRDADGGDKPYLALKLRPGAIPRIPAPVPAYGIFVCSPRLEGVHLRGGKVARGGLRWSERPEDFRTEVLGLVKAQRVKNAVIVPVGSKGGFVAKRLPAPGDSGDVQREVVACYRLFISGLLDLTDNLAGKKVIPPPQAVRLDDDDPYLVVAADKGTATFSDIANELSLACGFWLGDAFASGGSVGYDHKKMGITARGAWESVKRHFRELGKDVQSADFTAVGIGDMGGDVFGNGMLLSPHIRLVAAFNHRHIFIDPSPDAAAGHRERLRLFESSDASWANYDRELLSPGGGVFERSAKSIALSVQAKKALGAGKERYAPDDLINLILKAEVELLWNGGIGTYVKASGETHEQAQDKSNDGVRVNASQLRCKVIGEGGNLGMTQLARVEYARGGGRCYTDAIDNSAGVDISDHEVNIKILLRAAIEAKQLAPNRRNATLARMQAEVGAMVLRNNYLQTQAISVAAVRGEELMGQQCRAIDALERKGLLDRAIEFLPNAAALEERREERAWLTRPELSVLLSYSKMDLYQALLDSKVPDDPYLAVEIDRYFPKLLAKRFPAQTRAHRLKREIIATQVTNDLVGTMGPSFHLRLGDLGGHSASEITRAYIAAREILDAPGANRAIESLDNQVAARVQLQMLGQVAASMRHCVVWLLRNQPGPLDIAALVRAYRPGCERLKARLQQTLGQSGAAALASRRDKFVAAGVPELVAQRIAALPTLGYALDIVAISTRRKHSIERAAEVYFRVREALDIGWIERAIDALPASDVWHERAQFRLGNDLRASHTAIASTVLSPKRASAAAMNTQWVESNLASIEAIEQMIAALKAEHTPDFAMLSVLIGELARLH